MIQFTDDFNKRIDNVASRIVDVYKPTTESASCEYLSCDFILWKPNGDIREGIPIRMSDKVKDWTDFYFTHVGMLGLFKEIEDSAEAMETEPGELDEWADHEQTEVARQIRQRVYEKVKGA